MLEFLYWSQSLSLTVALSSLVAFTPSHQPKSVHRKPTIISLGFLFMLFNQIILSLMSYLISYCISAELSPMLFAKTVVGVYLTVASLGVGVFLLKKRSFVIQQIDKISLGAIAICWTFIVPYTALSLNKIQGSHSSPVTDVILAFSWVFCFSKYLVQCFVNKRKQTLGLSYPFLVADFIYALSAAIYFAAQSTETMVQRLTVPCLAIATLCMTVALIRMRFVYRKTMKRTAIGTLNQNLVVNDENPDLPEAKFKKAPSTNYASSFADSEEDY